MQVRHTRVAAGRVPRPEQSVHAQPPQVARAQLAGDGGVEGGVQPRPRRGPDAERAEVRVRVARSRRPRRRSAAAGRRRAPSSASGNDQPSARRARRAAPTTRRSLGRRRSLRSGRSSSTIRIASASRPMPAEKVNRRPSRRPSPIRRSDRAAIAPASPRAASSHASRPAELPCEDAGRAGGQHAQRDAVGEAVHDLVVGAVAAHRDHQVSARPASQLAGVPGALGARHLDLAGGPKQGRHACDQRLVDAARGRGSTTRRARMRPVPYRHARQQPANDGVGGGLLRRPRRARAPGPGVGRRRATSRSGGGSRSTTARHWRSCWR